MSKQFPPIAGPVSQIRLTPTGVIVHRFNIIGTDSVILHVYQPIKFTCSDFATITSFTAAELPPGARAAEWGELNGERYAWFGLVTDPAAVQAAIDVTFPGMQASQNIPGAGHQARIENWERCSPEYRALAAKTACPICGMCNGRPRRCRECCNYGLEVPTQAKGKGR